MNAVILMVCLAAPSVKTHIHVFDEARTPIQDANVRSGSERDAPILSVSGEDGYAELEIPDPPATGTVVPRYSAYVERDGFEGKTITITAEREALVRGQVVSLRKMTQRALRGPTVTTFTAPVTTGSHGCEPCNASGPTYRVLSPPVSPCQICVQAPSPPTCSICDPCGAASITYPPIVSQGGNGTRTPVSAATPIGYSTTARIVYTAPSPAPSYATYLGPTYASAAPAPAISSPLTVSHIVQSYAPLPTYPTIPVAVRSYPAQANSAMTPSAVSPYSIPRSSVPLIPTAYVTRAAVPSFWP